MSDGGISGVASKIPPSGWAIAIGGGLFIAFYLRSRGASATSTATGSGSGTPVDLSNGVGTGAVGGQWIPVSPPPAPTGPTDIESWGEAALTYLMGQNYKPVDAMAALRSFIDGQALTSAQQTMIDVALKGVPLPANTPIPLYGGTVPPPVTTPPPQQAPPPVTSPAPPPPPPPAPAPAPPRTFTVHKWVNGGLGEGSSLASIAYLMYGNQMLWPKIYNANRNQISNPAIIHPGQVLIIPN